MFCHICRIKDKYITHNTTVKGGRLTGQGFSIRSQFTDIENTKSSLSIQNE